MSQLGARLDHCCDGERSRHQLGWVLHNFFDIDPVTMSVMVYAESRRRCIRRNSLERWGGTLTFVARPVECGRDLQVRVPYRPPLAYRTDHLFTLHAWEQKLFCIKKKKKKNEIFVLARPVLPVCSLSCSAARAWVSHGSDFREGARAFGGAAG